MRLKTLFIPIIFVVILAVGIKGFDAAGLWQTESSKVPVKIEDGEFAGMSDPADIRGSYSFGDVADNFDVEASVIAEAFGIETESPETILCKDLEGIYPSEGDALEIGTGSVRQFVALYTGIPYDGDDGFPSTAIRVLRQAGIWNDELEASLSDRIVEIGGAAVQGSGGGTGETGETPAEDHEETIGVKGKTTVEEVLDWGLSLEQIEEVLGVKVDNTNLPIRDICTQNELAFSEIKATLNDMLIVE